MTVEILDVDTCLRLLATRNVGRVAVVDGQGPLMLPVNYVLDRGSVVFRTDLGAKLAAAERRSPAAFEVDEINPSRRHGWSILVRGRLVEIADEGELERVRDLPLRPFAEGERAHYVQVVAATITGRRIRDDAFRPQPNDLPELGENVWWGRDGDDLLA